MLISTTVYNMKCKTYTFYFKKKLKIKIDVIQLKLKIRNLMLLYNCYETKVKRTTLTKRFQFQTMSVQDKVKECRQHQYLITHL